MNEGRGARGSEAPPPGPAGHSGAPSRSSHFRGIVLGRGALGVPLHGKRHGKGLRTPSRQSVFQSGWFPKVSSARGPLAQTEFPEGISFLILLNGSILVSKKGNGFRAHLHACVCARACPAVAHVSTPGCEKRVLSQVQKWQRPSLSAAATATVSGAEPANESDGPRRWATPLPTSQRGLEHAWATQQPLLLQGRCPAQLGAQPPGRPVRTAPEP